MLTRHAVSVLSLLVFLLAGALGRPTAALASPPQTAQPTQPSLVTTNYDPAKNRTEVSSPTMALMDAAGDLVGLNLDLRTSHSGTKPTPSLLVFLTVGLRDSEDRARSRRSGLELLADGQPVEIPNAKIGTIALGVPLSTFSALATSSRVEGRAYGRTFVLTKPQMEVLKEIAAVVIPTNSRVEFKTEYDRFKDQTTVSTEPVGLVTKDGKLAGVSLRLSATYAGQTPSASTTVLLSVRQLDSARG